MFHKDTIKLSENIETTPQNYQNQKLSDQNQNIRTMTSHGATVAAFNLAEKNSKEAALLAEEAAARVVEADRYIALQFRQLMAKSEIVRDISDILNEESLKLAAKMVQAKEELDESRRALVREYTGNMGLRHAYDQAEAVSVTD